MKNRTLIFAIILLLLPLTSAETICSDGSEPISKNRYIEIGDKKSVNGLGIGVIDTDEAIAIGRIAAKLLLESEKIYLSDESTATATQDFELDETEYTIELLGKTSEGIEIEIEDSSEEIEIGQDATIKGVRINLIKVEESPILSIEALVGLERINLATETTLKEIRTFDDTQYLIELVCASDNDALLSVTKCESGELIEIPEEIPEEQNQTEPIENEPEKNETNQTQQTTPETYEPGLFKKVIDWIKDLFRISN